MDYTKFEKNFFRKKWTGRTSIALVFPNHYAVGMSNLGFLYVYQRLNLYQEIVCERVFLPEKNQKLRSVESFRPLKDFDLILFSVPFEVDYINVLKILKDGELGLDPIQRKQPVLAGGVATWLNPEPLSPFIDAFLLGEWEEMEPQIIPLLVEYSQDKKTLLKHLSFLPFVYLPSQRNSQKIKVLKTKNPTQVVYSTLISEKATFSETYLIEVAKGCGRACRFCAAGFVYRPPRSYPEEVLSEVIENIPENSKVGIIGLEFANKQEILKFGQKLLEKGCTLTFSSLRIDALNEDFLALLKGTKSIAIAPETASPRLKRVINKNLTEEEIFEALEKFQEKGLKNIKFYFMLGLPFETQEDLEETTKFIKKLLAQGFHLNFSFTFSFFVPKPHTPFQWTEFLGLKVLKEKERWIKKELRQVKNLKVEPPEEALLQTLIARGNKDLKDFLLSLAEGKNLKKALKILPKVSEFLRPEGSLKISFPWDKIDLGVKKEYLWREWQRAKELKLTGFCKPETCKLCGACDKKKV
ncbi:radical SAM protein [Thermodesulfobacterium sp. TA1]|uniref:radical SAM protein n=1 Tax=Thermodesulfobacterium sp. TA1 TaxID=2234087 RepID=UPI0012319A94|nr:radical SAM protein [Thermodesulfobacterium sp. TA1]QER41983.1 radical SAM protein [Thermodesulfobacterium sp. TA1]